MPFEVTEEWLQKFNQSLRAADVAPRQRPWLAWIELGKTTGLPVDGDDPRVKAIFDWFEKNTKPGSQVIGPAFTGVFFFDGSFWPFNVPLVFGRARVDLLDCLATMPEASKREIGRDAPLLEQVRRLWK